MMRAYPAIRQTHREHLQWELKQLENWLVFNVERGVLKAPSLPETTQRFSYRLLMQLETKRTFTGSLSSQANKLAVDEHVLDLWATLSAHFTPAGQSEYSCLISTPFEQQ